MVELKKNRLEVLIIGIIVAATVICGLVFINVVIKRHLTENTYSTLTEILSQQAYNFTSKIKADMLLTDTIAYHASEEEYEPPQILEFINEFLPQTSFDAMLVVDSAMQAYSNNGEFLDLADRNYLKKVFETGKTVISTPLTSRLSNQNNIIVIASPIKNKGEVIGAIVGVYDTEKLGNVFLPSFAGQGSTYVTGVNGDIITKSDNTGEIVANNLFTQWENADFYNDTTIEGTKENIFMKESGYAFYSQNGEKYITHYKDLGINEWVIFTIIPDRIISQSANSISSFVYTMSIIFFLAFAFIFVWVYRLQKKNIKALTHIAYTDELTGARNLIKFKIDAYKMLKENTQTRYAISKMDIDRFKLINELYGFEEGDNLLISISDTIKEILNSKTDIYARIASDEFIMLFEYINAKSFKNMQAKFDEAFSKIHVTDHSYNLIFPTGRYAIDEGETDIDIIFEKVNYAHRKAKQQRISHVCDYDEQTKTGALREKELENKMDGALSGGEFKVYLQPKYYLADEKLAGAEALVRWECDGKLISPGDFIPLFEQNGFVTKLDMYIFKKVCSIISEQINMGLSPVTISVNFSRNHLNNKRFVEELCKIADSYNTPHRFLEIELTETAIFDNEEQILTVAKQLHSKGFTLSMDDFGTGYSSLGLLKNIPVDVIKLDRSFFTFTTDTGRAQKVIFNVIRLAKELNIKIVAEGVEEKEQIDLLKQADCDIVQGFYYARPMPYKEFKL